MNCLDCPLNYVGLRGRVFRNRYQEYLQAIGNNNSKSGYLKHIKNIGHNYGTITNITDMIRTHIKGRHLNVLKKCHMHQISKDSLQ
jgi:hypothetical protein